MFQTHNEDAYRERLLKEMRSHRNAKLTQCILLFFTTTWCVLTAHITVPYVWNETKLLAAEQLQRAAKAVKGAAVADSSQLLRSYRPTVTSEQEPPVRVANNTRPQDPNMPPRMDILALQQERLPEEARRIIYVDK